METLERSSPFLNREILITATTYLGELLSSKKDDYNIVIVTPHPALGRVGAGHSRQGLIMRDLFERFGIPFTHINLEKIGGRVFSKLYPYLQAVPWAYRRISGFLNNPQLPYVVDWIEKITMQQMSIYSEIIWNSLTNSPNFHLPRNSIFISTHVAGVIGIVELFRRKEISEGVVFEYVPDPWLETELRLMTSPFYAENHFVIVHDQDTANIYQRIRPNLPPQRILPLGTLSPNFMGELDSYKPESNQPFHIGIEFSGNPIPQYDLKILKIIESMKEDIENGRLRLTLHLMWHSQSYDAIIKKLQELGLQNHPNIRIIYFSPFSPSEQDYADKALISRHNYIRGVDDWPPPEGVITKGGEVPLEDRGRILSVVIYGEGHEERDTQIGVREGRAVDFRAIPPREVYPSTKLLLKQRRETPPSFPPCSLAHLALLAYLDPNYFNSKIFPAGIF